MSEEKPIYEKVLVTRTDKEGIDQTFYADLRYRKSLRSMLSQSEKDDLELLEIRQRNSRSQIKTVRFSTLEIQILNAMAGYKKTSASEYIRSLIYADLFNVDLQNTNSISKEENAIG